jgi:hypothetical protein
MDADLNNHCSWGVLGGLWKEDWPASVGGLDDLSIPLRCPACRKMHHWQRKDAWIKQD